MMKRNRVLYLSYDGLTDPLGQSQILPYLTGLAQDYEITIVSFEKNNPFRRDGAHIKEICEKAGIAWHPLPYHKKPPVFSTLYDLWRLRSVAGKLQRRNAFRLVHCRSYLTALVGVWMKRMYGVKFIFDMRGFWADERIEGGLWNLKNPLFKVVYTFFKKKEQTFLRLADYTVVLTHAAGRQLDAWQNKSPVKIIPCCADLDFFDPGTISAQRQEELCHALRIREGEYVLAYIGSLGTWYMYDEMVLFYNCLKKIHPTARMLFLTPDVHKVAPREDFIIRSVSRVDVPAYLSLCNASICFVRPTFSKKGSSATKMAEAMAMGIPLVVNSGWGDVEEVIEGAACGRIIRDFEEAALTQAVKEFVAGDFQRDTIRKTALNYFSLNEGIKGYRKIYDELSESI